MNEQQKDVLWGIYQSTYGRLPERKQRIELAKKLNSTEAKIYKWFFDTRRRVE